MSSSSMQQVADGVRPAAAGKCLELAMTGERLCRAGGADNVAQGIKQLEMALTCGTDDVRTLSAIYSQLGNAFFTMAQYERALEYHRHDLVLTKTFRDELGEAKACGNLANTLRAVGQYEQAIMCAQYHLKLARKLDDKACISRALYNLGNAYHARGKHVGRLVAHASGGGGGGGGNRLSAASLGMDASTATAWTEPGGTGGGRNAITDEVELLLRKALECYEENARVAHELGDRAAEGRAWGNLGNTFYLLGEFDAAIRYHHKRLCLAKEFGDGAAIRRAYTNLANAHLFLGQLDVAVDYYKKALSQAVASSDQVAEAQVCFSLGNTLALANRCADACDYHTRHLRIARLRSDKAGLARAAWSLGTAYTAQGEYRKALYFVLLHYRTSREIGDTNGETVAEANMAELERVYNEQQQQQPAPVPQPQSQSQSQQQARYDAFGFMPDASADPSPVDVLAGMNLDALAGRVRSIYRKRSALESTSSSVCGGGGGGQQRRHSADRLPVLRADDVRISWRPDADKAKQRTTGRPEEDFFDFLSRMQCKRIDDQRCDAARLAAGAQHTADSAAPARPMYRAADSLRPGGSACTDYGDAVSTGSDQALLSVTPRRQRHMRRCVSASSSSPSPAVAAAHVRPRAGALLCRLHWHWPPVPLVRHGPDRAPLLLHHDVSMEADDGNLGLDGAPNAPGGAAQSPEAFVDMIVGMQARRMNDQRTELAFLPGLQRPARHRADTVSNGVANNQSNDNHMDNADKGKENEQHACSSQQNAPARTSKAKDEDFLDFVMRLQSHRIEEQRSAPPSALSAAQSSSSSTAAVAAGNSASAHSALDRASALSQQHRRNEDDIANVVDRMRAGRYNDQRTMLPPAAPTSRPSSSQTATEDSGDTHGRHRRSLSERLKRHNK